MGITHFQILLLVKLLILTTVLPAQELDTLILQPNGGNGKDAILYDLQPNNNYGTHPQINAQAWTNAGSPQIMRGLLQFDLSQLPENSDIEKVYLSLYHHVASGNSGHSQISGSNVSNLKKVIEEWNENTVTWNSQPSTDNSNRVILSASVSEDQDYLDIDITNLILDSNGELLDNYGIMLSLQTESYYRSLVFASSDAADSTIRPKLVVTYKSNCSVTSNPVDLGPDITLCQGQILMLDATFTDGIYLWQDGSTSSTIDVVFPGTYWVEVTTCSGVYRDSIDISLAPLPSIGLNSDTTFCSGDTIILDTSTSDASYLWQDGSIESTFMTTFEGEYWVQISIDGCSTLHTFNLAERDCEVVLILPNVFTPNGDGINDLFIPIESKGIASMKTIVLNRSGQIIFSTNRPMIEWDSVMDNGKRASSGVYFYLSEYTDIRGNSSSVKGYLTIMR
jgi:gliding motility-associated-like protein